MLLWSLKNGFLDHSKLKWWMHIGARCTAIQIQFAHANIKYYRQEIDTWWQKLHLLKGSCSVQNRNIIIAKVFSPVVSKLRSYSFVSGQFQSLDSHGSHLCAQDSNDWLGDISILCFACRNFKIVIYIISYFWSRK